MEQLRGLELVVIGGRIQRKTNSLFFVRSDSPGQPYRVSYRNRRWLCGCEQFKKTRRICRHIFATLYFLDLPRIVLTNSYPASGMCPNNESHEVVHRGKRYNKSGTVDLFWCKQCNKRFPENLAGGKGGQMVAIAIIALDLHFRNVSLANISEHIRLTYGITRTPQAYFYWIKKFTKMAMGVIRSKPIKTGNHWHADEFFVREKGQQKYVWNVLDHDTRKLIVSVLLDGRGEKEALKAIEDAIKRAGKKPAKISTDGLPSYSKALVEYAGEIEHVKNVGIAKKENNNMVESMHSMMRSLARASRGIKSGESFADGFYVYYNYIRPHGSLDNRPPNKQRLGWPNLLGNGSRK